MCCVSEACEFVFMYSDSETEPLGDLGELKENEIEDDGAGADNVLTIRMTIYLSFLTNMTSLRNKNKEGTAAAEDNFLGEMNAEEQADAEDL